MKINTTSSHMETILNYVLEPYVLTNSDEVQNAPVDLFDDKGRLLLIKGELISQEILALASKKQLYTIHAASNSQTDLFREVNLISVKCLIEACQAVNVLLTNLMEDLTFKSKFNELRLYDTSIYDHCMNVALLSNILGKNMGFRTKDLEELTLGALLHDVGKLAISLDILNKPSHLTKEEYEIIKRHPQFGLEELKGIKLPPAVLEGITKHHERWNGKGYPLGLSGDDIPINAQIIAVADVFDAITANRSYRPGLPPYHALEMLMRGIDTEFAPSVVKAFSKLLKLYPKNSWVTLNTGEVGTVTAVNLEHPTRPTVRLLFDQYGQHVMGINDINLYEDKERFVCTIMYMENSPVNILVVSKDSEAIRQAIYEEESVRYICDECSKVEDLHKFYGQKLYDVIIAELDGSKDYSFIKEQREQNPMSKIIVNIKNNTESTQLAVEFGASAVFSGNLDMSQILEIIAKVKPAKQ